MITMKLLLLNFSMIRVAHSTCLGGLKFGLKKKKKKGAIWSKIKRVQFAVQEG